MGDTAEELRRRPGGSVEPPAPRPIEPFNEPSSPWGCRPGWFLTGCNPGTPYRVDKSRTNPTPSLRGKTQNWSARDSTCLPSHRFRIRKTGSLLLPCRPRRTTRASYHGQATRPMTGTRSSLWRWPRSGCARHFPQSHNTSGWIDRVVSVGRAVE